MVSLRAGNIVLLNLTVIPFLQLGLNWQESFCESYSNIFQLLFWIVIVVRLIVDEVYHNNKMSWNSFALCLILTSAVLLAPLAGYQIYALVSHDTAFARGQSAGNGACFQNRIIFLAQIIFCLLILVKDIFYIGLNCKEHSNPTNAAK